MGEQEKSETWRDWQYPELDEPALLTRNGVLALLERLGLADIDERKLRYWETEGVLPMPVRQRYKGATRAMYPIWYANLVFALRHLQERGYTLDQLPNRMRLLARYYSYAEEAYAPPEDDPDERWRTEEPPVLPFKTYYRDDQDWWFESKIKPFLLRNIMPHARPSMYRAGRLVSVELTLVDEDGERVSYSFPIPATYEKPGKGVSDS